MEKGGQEYHAANVVRCSSESQEEEGSLCVNVRYVWLTFGT